MGQERLLAEVKNDAEVIGNVYENPEMLRENQRRKAVERKAESTT
jgi:hypothetical protein